MRVYNGKIVVFDDVTVDKSLSR
ncbi:MAG: hypothetical protein E7613_02215 [Ruminococcaceae bacterium]|nr:hypothetical protein [Oscillospiraceae bacterium]